MSNDFSLGEVHVSLSPQERFAEYLQSRGKRITQQRRSLVDFIFERHDHFDADELIANLRRQHEGDKISRPTVYRTLNELVEAGLLRKMTLGGRAVYEHDYGYPQHDHLHCQMCDKLIEFSSDELQQTPRRGRPRAPLPRHRPPADRHRRLPGVQPQTPPPAVAAGSGLTEAEPQSSASRGSRFALRIYLRIWLR